MNKAPIDLMLFDFDGTLFDSIPSAVSAVQMMLAALNYPPQTPEEIHRHVGFGEVPLISGSIGTDDPERVKQAMETYLWHLKHHTIHHIQLFPHVREMLEHFSPKPKFILSNKSDELMNIILEKNDLLKYFEKVMGGDTSPCLKPDPCVINELLAKKKIDPKRVLLVGDMVVDIQTGKNAGIITCGVTYGFDGKEKLEASHPDHLIDDILKLTELFS